MKVLLGETRSAYNLQKIDDLQWGRLFNLRRPTPMPFEPWGFDNKAFVTWQSVGFKAGLTRDDWAILWDADDFDRRIAEGLAVASNPYMAVTPDIPGGGMESLALSLEVRSDLPKDWPWYLAVQDGMKVEAVEESLHVFSGIFLGGSDRFKGTALMWCQLAHRHGKKFHYGRAGTLDKVKHAYMVGADSCDSSFPLWTKERMSKFIAHVGGLRVQGVMHERSDTGGRAGL